MTGANGNGAAAFDVNDPSGWELALVTNPTDSTAAATNSKLVSEKSKHSRLGTTFESEEVLICYWRLLNGF